MSERNGDDPSVPVWALVQECLDRRLDPLDEPAVQEAMSRDPALAAEVLALGETLSLIGTREPLTLSPAAPSHRSPLLVPALLTAALILLCCWIVIPVASSDPDPVQVSDAPPTLDGPADPPAAIQSFTFTLTRTQGDEVQERTQSGDAAGVSQVLAHHTPGHSTRWTERIRR